MQKNQTKKAALYIRVSTHYQIDKDSLPFQRNELINYAKYALGIDDYAIFEDAGYSGKNTDRPAYQDMMRRIRAKDFSHLCVWKIDRISRNLLDFSCSCVKFIASIGANCLLYAFSASSSFFQLMYRSHTL